MSFLNDLASEMVYPLVPALVTRVLGGGAVTLGLFDGIAEAVSAGSKLASGWIADRRAWRRPLVITGYAVASVARPAIGMAGAAWHVIGLRAADRFGKGVRTPARDAVIADATPPTVRGRAFGIQRGMDHAGAVAGPVIAWAMLSLGSMAPDRVIRWTLLPGVLAVLLVAWALRAEAREASADASGTRPSDRPAEAPNAATPSLIAFIFVFAFLRFPETLLLLRLQDLGLAVSLVPLVWGALHVVRSVASYPGGLLSGRAGAARAMIGGWAIYAVACGGLAAAASSGAAVAWFLMFGLVAAATEAAERAFVAARGGTFKRGRAFGAYHAGVGMSALPGGLLFGLLYSQLGGSVALIASAAGAAALCVVGARSVEQ